MGLIRSILGTVWGLLRWLGALVLWLLMPWRWFRRRPQAATVPAPAEAGVATEDDWPEMPRLGRSGTATDEQVEALMELRVTPAPPCRDLHDYSTEEAQAILDAVAFARAVTSQVTGGEDEEAPAEALTALLNDLLAETLADGELRTFALRWARNGGPTPLRENTTFERARAVVLRHWQPHEATAAS